MAVLAGWSAVGCFGKTVGTDLALTSFFGTVLFVAVLAGWSTACFAAAPSNFSSIVESVVEASEVRFVSLLAVESAVLAASPLLGTLAIAVEFTLLVPSLVSLLAVLAIDSVVSFVSLLPVVSLASLAAMLSVLVFSEEAWELVSEAAAEVLVLAVLVALPSEVAVLAAVLVAASVLVASLCPVSLFAFAVTVAVWVSVVVSALTGLASPKIKDKPNNTDVTPKLYFRILKRCLASSVCRALNFLVLGINIFNPLFYC